MNPVETPMNPQQPDANSEPIPVYDRAILWMFMMGFLVIGIILVSDLIAGFFR